MMRMKWVNPHTSFRRMVGMLSVLTKCQWLLCGPSPPGSTFPVSPICLPHLSASPTSCKSQVRSPLFHITSSDHENPRNCLFFQTEYLETGSTHLYNIGFYYIPLIIMLYLCNQSAFDSRWKEVWNGESVRSLRSWRQGQWPTVFYLVCAWAVFSPGGLDGEESAFKLIQVVGRIQVRAQHFVGSWLETLPIVRDTAHSPCHVGVQISSSTWQFVSSRP